MPMPTTSPAATLFSSHGSSVSSVMTGSPYFSGVAAASTYNHRGVMTPTPNANALGLMRCTFIQSDSVPNSRRSSVWSGLYSVTNRARTFADLLFASDAKQRDSSNIPSVIDRPPRPPRSETREVVELNKIKADQPELAPAVEMQLALVEMQRRVQARVPLARLQVDPAWLRAQHAAARPAIRFSDIPLEWTDFRLTFRQTADILLRFEALERPDHERIVALGRDGNALEPLVTRW